MNHLNSQSLPPNYVELHAHSYYSLLDGVPTPEQLVQHAASLGLPALALTDHDALYGAPRFVQAASQAGIKPILGVELTLVNGGGHLTLLAENDLGYANLSQLITLARREQTKGVAALPWRLLTDHAQGLIALSGCRKSEIARALLARDARHARHAAERFAAIFGRDHFFLELQRHHERGDRRLNHGLAWLGEMLGLPLVATGNVHYLTPAQARLHDILTCIRHRVPLEQAGDLLRPNTEYTFRTPAEMTALFAAWPEALRATVEIAERCQARLPHGPQTLPQLLLPAHMPAIAFLRRLCEEALPRKAPHPRRAYQATLERELEIIAEQGLAAYFLSVWDLVRFARRQGILCQGRGSAANSLVAYLLDITPIDPLTAGLVFERFLSRERLTAPDIDLDFDAARREEVIQYLYQRYGHEHTAMACTVVTFGLRQALRDVGMALGFSPEMIAQVGASVDYRWPVAASEPGDAPASQPLAPRARQLLDLAAALDGFPRHLGIHNGGMILSGLPLAAQIPIEPATMEDRTVVQWDKDALEMQGWIKLDVLALRMLSAIADACDLIAQQGSPRPDLPALRFDDPQVYDMLCRGETIGVFQVESRAQASLIPRFQPRSFADLTIEIALIRPGPVQANMVHPYLRRRRGEEPVHYLHPRLQPALAETLGVILFQEQVLKVARDVAGFTPGAGELLRRALGHKRAEEAIESFREQFIGGAQAQGVARSAAAQIFAQLKAFGGYSFSKAHAAAFAVITYWSAWLRCYHPVAFFAGLLRHQPMGFYPKHVVVADAQRAGVRFLPVDLRFSQAAAQVENGAIRLGLLDVHGFGAEQVEVIEDERRRRPFAGLADLVQRTRLDRRHVEALTLAGALDYLGERRQVLWDLAEAYHLARRPQQAPLPLRRADEQVKLPAMPRETRLTTAFAFSGVSLEGHLSSVRRDAFTRAGARPIGELPRLKHGQRVTIGGILVARQHPPTSKGFCFLAVEDPDGIVNVILAPDVYARCREATRRLFVLVEGVVQKEGGAIHVMAQTVTAL
ncbi:DNA polymerase III subunit alpha [Candidatus Amarolinea aalborgensis]|uniref:DNA polymerase III subunit alpha n=1 Tax=Candidatus Amarolinea aalborgensis TaxID=2249329 RepID=UPI003BFA3972